MTSEEFLLIGIQDEKSAQGTIKLEELKALLCEHCQVDPYYAPLLEALSEVGVLFEEKTKIDIKLIFKALSSAKFIQVIPSYMHKRITKYNIKLLKAGLIAYVKGYLTMKQIGDAASVHQMKEFENLAVGIPCTEEAILSCLWIIKRTIPTSVLHRWIDIHEDYLEVRNTLMVHEFLYLVCNTKDKEEMYQRIPRLQMNPRMNKDNQLFQVDQEFHKTYKSPDYKMQHMLNAWYNPEKANYDGISKVALQTNQANPKMKGKLTIKLDSDAPQDANAMFKKQLRSLLVTVEIKNRIRNANQKVSKMKLNGKAAYDELTANTPAHLTSDLPPAFGTKDYRDPNSEFPDVPKSSRSYGNRNRPMTAQRLTTEVASTQALRVRPQTSLASNTPVMPAMNRVQSAQKSNLRIQTAQARGPTSPSVMSNATDTRKYSTINANINVKKIQFSFFNERPQTASTMKFRTGRGTLENTNYTSNHSRADTVMTFEDVFDQEYYMFEESNKPKTNKHSVLIKNPSRINQHRMFSA